MDGSPWKDGCINGASLASLKDELVGSGADVEDPARASFSLGSVASGTYDFDAHMDIRSCSFLICLGQLSNEAAELINGGRYASTLAVNSVSS